MREQIFIPSIFIILSSSEGKDWFQNCQSFPAHRDGFPDPSVQVDDEENVRTPPNLGSYWEIRPLRPQNFPMPPVFWWSTDTIFPFVLVGGQNGFFGDN